MSLTPRALVLAGLLALVILTSLWSDHTGLTLLWQVAVLAYVAALFYEWKGVRTASLDLELVPPERASLGRSSLLEVCFANGGGRGEILEWLLYPPQELAMNSALRRIQLAPSERVVTRIKFTPLELGNHVWPGVTCRMLGALGLAYWAKPLRSDACVQVVPDSIQREENLPGVVGGNRAVRRLGRGSSLLELRDYRIGDPLHNIDWKATARTNRPIVRETTDEQHLEIMLLVDVGRGSGLRVGALSQLGHLVNLTARLAEIAVRREDRVGLVVFADQPLLTIAPARGLAGVARLRQALGQLRSREVESNPLSAVVHAHRLLRQRSLVLLAADLADAEGAGQLQTCARLLLPKHLPMLVSLRDEDVDDLALQRAQGWLDPYVALAAQDARQHVDGNVRRLRQLGAVVTHARPAEIDRAVLDTYLRLRGRHRI